MNALDNLRPLGLLLMRIGLGLIFVYHGYPKLFGETERFAQFFVSIGLAAQLVWVAGIVEFFGGALLIAGMFTRVAALLLAGQMAVAIWKAHSAKGLLAVGEYEFPLALAVAAFALATIGAGKLSLDFAIFRQKA